MRGDGAVRHPHHVFGGYAVRERRAGVRDISHGRRVARFSVLQPESRNHLSGRFRSAPDRVSAGMLRHAVDPEDVHALKRAGAAARAGHSAAGCFPLGLAASPSEPADLHR